MAPPWKEIDKEHPKVPSRLPGKDGHGTLGKEIKLFTNFFRVSFELPNVNLYLFNVNIDDSSDKMSAAPTHIGTGGAAPAPQKEKAAKKNKCRGKQKEKKNSEKVEQSVLSSNSEIQCLDAEKGEFKRRIPKQKQRRIFAAFVKDHPKVFEDHNSDPCWMAYDGEAYCASSRKPSQFKSKTPFLCNFVYKDDQDQQTKTYRITFKLVNQGKLQTLLNHMKETTHVSSMPSCYANLFQMLEIIFNYEKTVKFQSVMRNQFFSQEQQMFGQNFGLGGGGIKEGVIGFSCSLSPVQGFNGWKDPGKLMLNVDIKHAPFYSPQPLLEFLLRLGSQINPKKRLSPFTIRCINEEIVKRNLKVVTTHTPHPYTYVVRGVSEQTPDTHSFESNGKMVTVKQYLHERYHYKVKYPNMQCLQVGNKDALMPIEVCKIAPNQRAKGKLSDEEMKQFVAHSVIAPHNRKSRIQKIMGLNNFKEDPFLKQLGAVISEDFEKVDGRVLPAPVVVMKPGATKNPEAASKGGVWDVRQNKFFKAAALDQWAVINFCSMIQPEQIEKFVASILRLGKNRGMITAKPLTVVKEANLLNAADALRTVKKNYSTVNFILCFKTKEKEYYNIIKTTGERELGVATSSVLTQNVTKCDNAVVGNLLFKINTHLGGINHSSSYPMQPNFNKIFSEAIVVMGADANHPPADDCYSPSVVAVVGSTDQLATQYAVEVRAQQRRRDMIVDIMNMTKNLLVQYYRSTENKPTRIVMFRDGVSESEFETVLRLEMMAMREACSAMKPENTYKPAITFICVQKRHSTRMFCQDIKDEDRSGNVPAGTVMDTVVIQSLADFYLCSHEGILGTSKPAHYIVLWDDSSFSMDQLQLLTNSLCYNYSRCSRAVSIPAPVYYAHLAAFRGKVHLAAAQKTNPQDWTCVDKNGSFSDEILTQAVNVDIKSDISKKMYFT